jgi:lactoylglutathione lyase
MQYLPPVEMRFDHVGLSVTDLSGAAAFYIAAFGYREQLTFTLGETGIRGAMLTHDSGHRFELFEHPAPAPGLQAGTPIEALGTRGYGHLAFACADIEVPFHRALALGARSVLEPSPSPEPGVRFAFLADPEGNLIELVELA